MEFYPYGSVLALQALGIALIWVPFAIAAGFVDTWHTEGGRRFREDVAWRMREAFALRA